MKIVFSLIFLISLSFLIYPSFADEEIGGEGYGEKALLLEYEIINLFLFSFLIILIISLIRNNQFHKTNPSWIYFLMAIILFAMTRVFYITSDSGIIKISDDTLEVFWHLIFFNSLILFLFSIKNIMHKSEHVEHKSLKNCIIVCSVSISLAILIFFIAEPLDSSFVSVFSDTYLANMGIQHLIAFTFTSLVAFTLIEIRSFPERFDQNYFLPLVSSFIILIIYHVWEMLTESLEIIVLPETVVEQVEQLLVIPILIFFIIGILSIRKLKMKVIQK